MARTEDDTWDLATSVGATATLVAAARAVASRAEGALIDDPFAEPLTRAVGVDLLTRLATGELTPADIDADSPLGMTRMAEMMAVRTVFFDRFFLAATAGTGPDGPDAACTQAVILASGLDARAYRLRWPAGTVVYEIDQAAVIDFKTRVLADLDAEPTAERRTVAVDLRDDWPAALVAAGFDPTLPTAWSAEGLLPYLPPDAQDRLLDAVTDLSAAGSTIATDTAPNFDPAALGGAHEQMAATTRRWREQGLDLDFADLIYFGERNDPAEYLGARGWQMSGATLGELFDHHGLAPIDDDDAVSSFADMTYLSGSLGGGASR